MGLRKKKTLMDQAGEFVDQLKPHAEAAMDSARDFVQDTVVPALTDAREKAGPALADARAKAAPVVAEARDAARDARDKAGPALADARAKAAPVLADARAKAAPVVAAATASAGERAAAARDLADAKVAEIKGEQPKKKGKLRKLALVAGLAGGAAFVAKKLQGGKQQSTSWQSSYTPSPAPSANAPAAPAASSVPTPPSEPSTPTPSAPQSGADDSGGASPDEALSDAAGDAHSVTTPDQPAEVVDLDGDSNR